MSAYVALQKHPFLCFLHILTDAVFQIWKVVAEGDDRKVEYLSSLQKHTQAVNVVRWAPKGRIREQ